MSPLSSGRDLLENLMQDGFYKIGWDGETEAVGGCIGLGIDRGQGWDADELPLHIDQGSATIAGIDDSWLYPGNGSLLLCF